MSVSMATYPAGSAPAGLLRRIRMLSHQGIYEHPNTGVAHNGVVTQFGGSTEIKFFYPSCGVRGYQVRVNDDRRYAATCGRCNGGKD